MSKDVMFELGQMMFDKNEAIRELKIALKTIAEFPIVHGNIETVNMQMIAKAALKNFPKEGS